LFYSFSIEGFYRMLEVRLVMKRSNQLTLACKTLQKMALLLLLCLGTSFASAQPNAISKNGDDTILIEKDGSSKVPYSHIAKAVFDHLFKVDIQKMFSGGKNLKTACVRNFSDYSDRTNYRIGVKQDEVEFKLSLNF
jgi:hypothetical protein